MSDQFGNNGGPAGPFAGSSGPFNGPSGPVNGSSGPFNGSARSSSGPAGVAGGPFDSRSQAASPAPVPSSAAPPAYTQSSRPSAPSAAKPLPNGTPVKRGIAPSVAPKRSFAGIAFLVIGVAFLASVLVYIAVDQLTKPQVNLPSQMPVAPEVQEWNRSVQEYVPSADNPTAVDPVSKEPVDPNKTPYKIDVYGTWFYFKSEANLKAFTDDPLRYLKINVNVKLLDNDGSSAGEQTQNVEISGGSNTTEGAASDNSSMYQQIPAPSNSEAANGSADFTAPGDTAPAVPSEPVPETSGEGATAGDASLYQQIPAPDGGSAGNPEAMAGGESAPPAADAPVPQGAQDTYGGITDYNLAQQGVPGGQ